MTFAGRPAALSFVARVHIDEDCETNIGSPLLSNDGGRGSSNVTSSPLACVPSLALQSPCAASSPVRGEWISNAADLLQLALCDETRNVFDEPHACGVLKRSTGCGSGSTGRLQKGTLTLFQFVEYFSDWAERLYLLQRQSAMPRDEFMRCKRLVFSAFYDMDRDDDGAVSFKDVTNYLMHQRAVTSELSKEQRFDVDHVFTFNGNNSAPVNGGDDDEEQYNAALRRAATGNDDDALRGDGSHIALDFEQPMLYRRLSGGPRSRKFFGALTRSKGFFFVDDQFEVRDSLASSSAAGSMLHVINRSSAILDFDTTASDDLVVSAHADRMLRVWCSRDARLASIRSGWHVVYQHQCANIPTAVCSHSRSDRVFSGSAKGDLMCWRISNSIISDYKKGDRDAFEKLLSRTWAGGGDGACGDLQPLHTDAIKAIQCFSHVDRVATCSLDGSAAIVDVVRGSDDVHRFRTSRGMLSLAICEAYSFIATAGYDTDPCIWDYTASNCKPNRLLDSADRHQDMVKSVCVIDNAGGGVSASSVILLGTIDASAKLKIWDLRMMRCIQSTSLQRFSHSTQQQQPQAKVGGLRGKNLGLQISSMMVPPWAPGSLLVGGSQLLSISEQTDVLPRRMAPECAIGIDFDLQSGMMVALHSDSTLTLWLQGEARGQLVLEPSDWKLPGESLRSITMFADRGRRALLTTSLGRIVSIHTETGGIAEIWKAFDRVPIKQCLIGSFDARPFVVSLSVEGELVCWSHPLIPSHIVLPPAVESITAISLGATDGELWIGGDDGCVYHVYLPEAACSEALLRPNAPVNFALSSNAGSARAVQTISLTLLRKLGVMFLLRSDGELVVFNSNFDAMVLHSCYPFSGSSSKTSSASAVPRHAVGITVTKRFGLHDGYVAVADDEGYVSIFKAGSKIVHPTSQATRKRSFQKILSRKDLFASVESTPTGVSSLCALPHWNAFAASSADCKCVLFDRHGSVLTSLTQHTTPWPIEVLPRVTNEDRSSRVISLLHRFFARLRRKAMARRSADVQRRPSVLGRRRSRVMSFSRAHGSIASGHGDAPPDDYFVAGTLLSSFSVISSDGSPAHAPQNPPPSSRVGEADGDFFQDSLLPVATSGKFSRTSSSACNKVVLSDRTPRRPQSARAPGQGLASRPSSAPQFERCATKEAVRCSPIIGTEGIKRPLLKQSLKAFTGQIAVISAKAKQGVDEGSINESSGRVVLPVALGRVIQQQALDEMELPPSTLWAPIPRPPSPLTSRMNRRRLQ